MIGLTKKQNPLACFLVFQNDELSVENTLNTLLECSYPLRLYIVDDGSTDETSSIIESVLAYYNREDVQFFQFSETLGRGVRLNELLSNANEYFFWIPDQIAAISTKNLEIAMDMLHDTACIHNKKLARLSTDHALSEEQLDANFLFNRKRLPNFELFFNPFLNQSNALELFLRIQQSIKVVGLDAWFQVLPNISLSLNQTTSRELEFSRIRLGGEVKSEPKTQEISGAADQKNLALKAKMISRCKEVLASGNRTLAGELLAILIDIYGETDQVLELKIHFYEKTSRYVEASEVKNQIQKRKDTERQPTESTEQDEVNLSQNDLESAQVDEYPQEGRDPVEDECQRDDSDEQDAYEDAEEEENIEEFTTASASGIEVNPPPFTVIIPTALDGLDPLAHCIAGIDENFSSEWCSIIVVDNASLDDTYEYLQNRQQDTEKPITVEVISNSTNVGYVASIKQALKSVKTDYVMLMHNDVQVQDAGVARLVEYLANHNEIGVLGASTPNTWNDKQRIANPDSSENEAEFVQTRQLDSFCMAFRTSDGHYWDEQFQLAYLEDIDFCYQLQQKGLKCGVLPNAWIHHTGIFTTSPMGLGFSGEHYSKQLMRFQKKWKMIPSLPKSYDTLRGVDRVFALAQLIDLWAPHQEMITEINDLLSDEVRNSIIQSSWTPIELETLIGVMMVSENRDILRNLEDKMPLEEYSTDMAMHLAMFYFVKNIYSRAKHYIKRFDTEKDIPLPIWITQYKIMVQERDVQAADKLSEILLKHYAWVPEIYKVTSDLYHFKGIKESREAFYGRAHLLNPYAYPQEEYLLD